MPSQMSLKVSQWVLATENPGKIKEFQGLFKRLPVALVFSPLEQSPEEVGETFQDNAFLKARAYSQHYGMTALADDSGLVIPALGGIPGVRSARWVQEQGGYSAAFTVLQQQLEALSLSSASAFFECVLCVCPFQGEATFHSAQLQGHLTFPPQGEAGFGFDPIFIPEGSSCTYGQMTLEEKAQVSHRRQAFKGLSQHWFPDFSDI